MQAIFRGADDHPETVDVVRLQSDSAIRGRQAQVASAAVWRRWVVARTTIAACHGWRPVIVEDEAMIAMLVEEMVLDFGSEVVGPAAKMDEALRLASQAPLDGGAVVFPVADVLQQRGIPIIFATGYGAGMLPSRFAHRRTLSKPFDYQSLAEALRAALADQPCHTQAGLYRHPSSGL